MIQAKYTQVQGDRDSYNLIKCGQKKRTLKVKHQLQLYCTRQHLKFVERFIELIGNLSVVPKSKTFVDSQQLQLPLGLSMILYLFL